MLQRGYIFSTDVRLTRVFSIKERVKRQFMAEAFNLFNIANLSGYGNGLVQTAAFGQPTVRAAQIFGSGGPRLPVWRAIELLSTFNPGD
jgi:hypothetical protein